MSQELFPNGLDASTGSYITEGITAQIIAKIARGQKLDAVDLKDIKIRKAIDAMNRPVFGVGEGINPSDLSQAGWSIIFPASLPTKSVEAIKEALNPLLDHRRAQAGAAKESYYKEVLGPDGYRPGETKNDFLKRFGRGPGAADPEKFPYYTLIAGDPETIPFSFQYQLDIQYATGRIHFDRLEDYYQYATSVVRAETAQATRPRKAAFFGVANPDDKATALSSQQLVKPLAECMQADYPGWDVELIQPEMTTKENLASILTGANAPALFFSASHGVRFNPGDPRQLRHQGALVCQNWGGPLAHTPLTDQIYFSADDVPSDANVSGMIAFIFACYGGGTPKGDNFYRQIFGTARNIAPYAFMAQLPLKLLSHPKGGALAVFAHVERAWTNSIRWDQTVRDVETFENTIKALLNGKPAGAATEYFNSRYAEISSDLAAELDSTDPEFQDEVKIAGLWTANNDARNYILIGDPAVRLNGSNGQSL
jgi:hypothetical protein